MAKVYRFEVKLNELEDKIWRVIDVSSLTTLSKFGCTNIVAFDGEGSHLFCVHVRNIGYDMYIESDNNLNARDFKLSELDLEIGDVINVTYDFGSGWKFKAKLVDVTEMGRGMGRKYPLIIDGHGNGIIEDLFPSQLEDIIENFEKTGVPYILQDLETEEEYIYDPSRFSVKYLNMYLKDKVLDLEETYS